MHASNPMPAATRSSNETKSACFDGSGSIFSEHDELLGDEAASVTQQIVANAGYNVSVDPKGVHRITSSTIKIISSLVDKE